MAAVSEHAAMPSLFDKKRRAYLFRKLHSLSGVVPVGGFLCFHLWTNAKAMQGQARFDSAVAEIHHMPYLAVLEAGILLPLLFHALYGVKLALESKPNVHLYPYSRNWMYTAQRTSGLVAFAFIVYHLWELWAQKQLGRLPAEQFYGALCANLSSTAKGVPVVALVYLVGIAASVFHFANGLWGFCFSWGITVSRRSQRAAAALFGLVGIAVFVLGANTAIYFATGSRLALPFAPASGPDKGSARTCVDIPLAPVDAVPGGG